MNCHDCRQQLQARLDGAAVPADEIAAHLAACPECRDLEAAAQRLQTGLRLLTPPAPPTGFAERLAAGVLADRRRKVRRRRLVFAGVIGALAASLLVVLFITPDDDGFTPAGWVKQKYYAVKWHVFPGTRYADDPSIRSLHQLGLNGAPPSDEEPVPSLNDNMAEATSAVASLARRTADETVSNGQILVPAVSLPMTEPEVLGPPLEPPAQSLREAGQGVATGLQPVAASAARAFDLFRRDITPVAPEAKSGL
jgi:hypothetical protein